MITLDFSKNCEVPLYKQIYEYFAQEIRQGILKEKSKLPSVRELSKNLGVSKITVETAYQQLCAEGYVVSVAKSGFVVTKVQEIFKHNKIDKTEKNGLQKNLEQENFLQTQKIEKNDFIDVSSSRVDESVFPSSVLKTLYREAVSGDNSKNFLCRGESLGEVDFRKTLAHHLFESRGVKCSYEQIIIGAGTEYLLSLAVKIIEKYKTSFLKQEKISEIQNEKSKLVFAVENPGYEKTQMIIQDNGAIVKKINLDENGISVEQIKSLDVDCVYCTPAHQYPLGITMPISRRSELLSWAYEDTSSVKKYDTKYDISSEVKYDKIYNTQEKLKYDIKYDNATAQKEDMTNCRFIIEDDYDSDYRYQGNPIPALQGFDTKDCVLYIGTFSRSLSPSMRVSYLVLPKRLMKVFCQDLSYYSNTVSRIEQYVLNKFIYDKHFERHINRTRKLYEQRRNVLINELKLTIPDIQIFGEDSGLHFIAKLDNEKYDISSEVKYDKICDSQEKLKYDTKADIKTDSLNMTKKYDNLYMTITKKAFDKKLLIGGTESFLIFCYAHIDESQAKQVANILGQILKEIMTK